MDKLFKILKGKKASSDEARDSLLGDGSSEEKEIWEQLRGNDLDVKPKKAFGDVAGGGRLLSA